MYIFRESPVVDLPKNVKTFKGGKIRFETVLQEVNHVNRNKRYYMKENMQEGIDAVMDRIRGREFMGELDHPIDSNPSRQVTVSFQNVSHLITEIGWDGNKLIGVLESLSTPSGQILHNLIKYDGIATGFSFRGLGSVEPINEGFGKTYNKVVGQISVITWDCVSYPSHPSAKINRSSITELTESVKREILESVNPANIVSENSNYICTKEGVCYLPNAWDQLVEQRKQYLKNRLFG